jgi:hypothetical protein
MKRRDLIRHIETMAVNSSAKAAITRSTSIAARRNHLPFHGIARSSISLRKRSAKTWTFRSHEFHVILPHEWSRREASDIDGKAREGEVGG